MSNDPPLDTSGPKRTMSKSEKRQERNKQKEAKRNLGKPNSADIQTGNNNRVQELTSGEQNEEITIIGESEIESIQPPRKQKIMRKRFSKFKQRVKNLRGNPLVPRGG